MENKFLLTITAFIILCALIPLKGYTQLKGDIVMGSVGLDAGTQTPAGTLSVSWINYFYNTSSLRNINGDEIANPNLNVYFTALGVNYVSKLKILGGNYGATVLFPFAQNSIQGNFVSSATTFAYTDMLINPVELGWHTKRADFNFTYGLYLPTGTYSPTGTNNSGLGMTTNQFTGGTTIHLDPKGTINFATAAAFEIHSKKGDSDLKPGDILSLQGGLGKAWYTIGPNKIPTSIIKFGVVYYMQFKVSDDQLPSIGQFTYVPGHDHVYALGLEGNVFMIGPGLLFGMRWLDEFGAVNRFRGNTFFITLAHAISTGRKK